MIMMVVVVVDLISAVGAMIMMMTLVIYTMVIIDFLHRVFKLDVLHFHRLVTTATVIMIILPVVVPTIIVHPSCNHNR
jgi:hypothetical protein